MSASQPVSPPPEPATATAPVRVVTAASLFDGHDAAINIMRRIMQSRGAEVIHLGHDRAVDEIVKAAIEEDAQAVAVSSYQGGHMEYFRYLVERLREEGRPDIPVFGGGGGTITDAEIASLHEDGVRRIYSVGDGRELGLVGMIDDMLTTARDEATAPAERTLDELVSAAAPPRQLLGRALSALERLHASGADETETALRELRAQIVDGRDGRSVPVLGITGTGGAGKSSLTDELIRRFRTEFPDRRFAVLSVDPTRRRTGGALLGDRIRMNAVYDPGVFVRSMATREAHRAVSASVRDAIALFEAAGYDLVILETAGIGQSDTEVVDLSDVAMYVMTPEFGAPSQLEKIGMLDYADLVALNKFDKRGAEDALQYVAKQIRRNRGLFDASLDEMPVFGCTASRFADAGVNALFDAIREALGKHDAGRWSRRGELPAAPAVDGIVPPSRVRYLSEIAETIRGYHGETESECSLAYRLDGLRRALAELGDEPPEGLAPYGESSDEDPAIERLRRRHDETLAELSPESRAVLSGFDTLRAQYTAETQSYAVRTREIEVRNFERTLSGNDVPRVAVPSTQDFAERLSWARRENVPGVFPFTGGVFPFKRTGEDPTRMFAGEGTPERTNRRFHYLSCDQPFARLSTAFDSVTLYGRDPAERPDVFGKVGNSGVSVATLDDAKRLYSGFDLCAPTTSVSMTINGPAPAILAMFLNTAIDQAVERRLRDTGRWEEAERTIAQLIEEQPTYRAADLPAGHDGSGLGLLGVSGAQLLEEDEYREIAGEVLRRVRGTVQADILKEDQAQNTCIFSTDFALKMMGDIQEYFVENSVRNFYSVSISGYHIAEAGANPITQLAFTLANGFTYVEYYRSRGLDVDDFARNLSFFFSNGLDPEYAVIGRVARRIWAVAMRELYGAGERSQKLKYHIQTSGRSLHAMEIAFNDIRTTLQALYAIMDNCNSLHTNAYDEAITTPTEESVRRALAIQMIINRELGLTKNENPLQGSYFIEQLTDLVEAAVLAEFDRITDRGGVLGAMETMYQRSKIQEESLEYERRKHSGDLPVVGVNTFVREGSEPTVPEVELSRSTDEEKREQIAGVAQFRANAGTRRDEALAALKQTALAGGNVFAELMETVRWCSLGDITNALFEVGGQYRRSM